MSTHLPFPLADFYDALVSKNLKQKLDPFIAQFRKKNIYIIYQCVNRLIQIIANKSELPIMKFNALMATRYFFDTCEYAAVIFIEIFMLPVIYEIAIEKYLKRSQQGIQLYFVDRGAENTKQIRRLGLNYVELAVEFIFNSAKVKPYRLIENKELKEESNFSRTVKVFNNKGILQAQKCIYYIPSYPGQTRKKFMKKLKHLSPQPYISFVISEYLEEINLNKKCDLDIKKLLLFGDSFLTSTIVEIIEEELSKMSQNFINKKKYLNLLNDLIRSGEIESIYLVNTTDFIRDIAEQISKVKGGMGPEQGEYIFPKIEASKQQKKQFFLEFLRVIQIWAHCMPSNDEGEQSDVLKIYEDLKKKNFIFPKNVILSKIKKQMEENLLMNQERNQTLMKLIDQDDRTSSRNVGSYVSSKGQFRFHFPQYKEKNSYLQLDDLQYKVFEAKKKIAKLSLRKQQFQQTIEFIQNFYENWEEDLEKLDIEDQDPHELQILVDEGDLCCEQFAKIFPFYEQYSNGMLSYEQFCKKIEFLEHSGENQSRSQEGQDNSEISQDRKNFMQSQHKPSNMSHSVRKHIQDEYYTQYGHHYQREEKSISSKNNNQKEEKQLTVRERNLNNNAQLRLEQPQHNESYIQESQKSQKRENNNKFRRQKSKKSVGRDSSVNSKSKMSQSRRQIQNQRQEVNYPNTQSPQTINDYIMANANKQNICQNLLKQSSIEQFDRQEQSQISSSQDQNQPHSSVQPQQQYQSPKKKIQFRTQKQATPPINFQSSGSNFKLQSIQKTPKKHQNPQPNQGSPYRKSVIKHSVISKSSYHSQPTEPKIVDSGFNEGNSMMNDYEYHNPPQVSNAGITVKKSSIKRTQNSGLKGSSHKRIQQTQTKSPQNISEAASPFKKKKSSISKDMKIKQSYLKEFEFVKSNKKPQTRKMNEQLTYDDVFRRRDQFQTSRNQSQISSQSESIISRRNKKLMKQEAMRQTARIRLHDESQQDNRSNSSILKRSKDKIQFKSSSKTPSKNIRLFDSKHSSPNKFIIQKVHQEYDLKIDNQNIKNLTDKISQVSKNTSKLDHPSKLKSGIKLISKNDHKSFDSLYKNEYNKLNTESAFNNNRMYQEVTSQYNQTLSRTNGPNSLKPHLNNFSPHEKSSFIQNPDYSPVSLEQINEQIKKFKNKANGHKNHPEISQIHQPQNVPMLYSYCSQKSIHSKMTDSHTRKGNSSNYNDFKACFLNMDKEVLPLNLTKSKAVSSSFSLDKAKNFIDFRVSNVKSSSKVNTVVDAISQKNAKNSILLYKLEREKTRLVQNLQHKIKQLEVNGKMMKTKFAVKDQSIRQNLQSRQYSQRQIKPNYPDIKSSRQSSNQNVSNYELLKKTKNQKDNRKQQQGLTSLTMNSRLINTKPYEQFFSTFAKTTSRKALHKKKGLLTKNDEIEIGYMISKKEKYCLVSVFITPYISSIKNVQVDVQCDHNLTAKVKPSKIDFIEAKKQQIVVCNFSVQNVPFKLPIITVSFDQSRNYKKNNYVLGLPCTLLSFSETTDQVLQFPDSNQQCEKQVLRTDIFKLSKKISKPQKLRQILPSFAQRKRQERVSCFEGVVKYQSHFFCVSIGVNDSGYVVIQGWSRSRYQQNSKFLEYLLSTIKFMVEQEVVWQD